MMTMMFFNINMNILFFVLLVFFGSVTYSFPFFHFHRSEVKNVTDAIGANTATLQEKQSTIPDPSFTVSGSPFAVNAPPPSAAEISSLLVIPTEPLKTDAEANLLRLAKIIHNKNNNNVDDNTLTAVFSPSEISSMINSVNNLQNVQQQQQQQQQKEETFQQHLAESLFNSIKNDPQFKDASVAVVGIMDATNNDNDKNKIVNTNENAVEQSTPSEIWLELNKVLSGDIPESKTISPILSQQQAPISSLNINNINDESPDGIAIIATDADNNVARQGLTYDEKKEVANELGIPLSQISNMEVIYRSPKTNTNLNQNAGTQTINGLSSPQEVRPIYRSHTFNNVNKLSDIFYDADKINAPVLQKPDGRPWYSKYVDVGEKAANWAQQKSSDLQNAYNDLKQNVIGVVNSEKKLQDVNDYYAQRSMEKQNQGVNNPYFNIF